MSLSGLFTSDEPIRGPGQDISDLVTDRVRRSPDSHGSGGDRVTRFSSITDRVRSRRVSLTRPGPREATPAVKSVVLFCWSSIVNLP